MKQGSTTTEQGCHAPETPAALLRLLDPTAKGQEGAWKLQPLRSEDGDPRAEATAPRNAAHAPRASTLHSEGMGVEDSLAQRRPYDTPPILLGSFSRTSI